MKTPVLIILICLFATACKKPNEPITTEQQSSVTQSPNIILLIGDGMGMSQVSSAFFYGEKAEPAFVRFPFIGLSRTSSATHKITDSAAGAVAFSCGKKTYNNSIALDLDSVTPLKSIIEITEAKGWSTGLISTSSITHATPAAFYAKVKHRKMEEDIATFLPRSGVDFFAGGGKQYFFHRSDSSSLLTDFEAASFIIDTLAIGNLKDKQVDKKGYLLADDGMPKMSEGRGDFLLNATLEALDFLTKKQTPFFLMIEGSQIDWGGHANDGQYLVNEVLDFEKAVAAALDFAEKDGNTLVIVTADHECGGFTMASAEYNVPFRGMQRDYDSLRLSFSTGGHSSTMVPVFAFGPSANQFAGVYHNTEIFHKMIAAAGL